MLSCSESFLAAPEHEMALAELSSVDDMCRCIVGDVRKIIIFRTSLVSEWTREHS